MSRIRYQRELRRLQDTVVEQLGVVAGQLALTIEALERGDDAVAAEVIRRDYEVDRRYAELQDDLVGLLARQAPVAGDLRKVTALLHVSRMVERMGDQCVNVAKLVPIAGPVPSGAEDFRGCLLDMGRHAHAAVRRAATALRGWDVELAAGLAETDRDVNELNRACFTQAIELGATESARKWGTAMILVARAFERIGDNAVDIGAHVRLAATGTYEPRPAAA
jgi:phosphate transport system protein